MSNWAGDGLIDSSGVVQQRKVFVLSGQRALLLHVVCGVLCVMPQSTVFGRELRAAVSP